MSLAKTKTTTKTKHDKSSMSSDIKKNGPRNNQPSSSYKKIVAVFIVCTFLLILVIVYFSLSRAEITLTVDQEKINQNMQIKIAQEIPQDTVGYLNGYITIDELQETKTWPVEQGEKQEARAKGMVMVTNTHSASQTLVATTRLLTPDNILFKTERTVVVPAGGKVQVMVQANSPGESGNVAPTKFTIPGLRDNLRKKIYAESYEPMSGGIVMIGSLTQEQVDQAIKQFADDIYQANIDKIGLLERTENPNLEKVLVKKIINQKVDQKIGDKVGSFDLTLTMKMAQILFDKTEVLELTKMELKKQIEQTRELINYDLDNFNYFLKEFNWETHEAVLDISLDAWVKAQIMADKIDKSELKGMNKEALITYFNPMDAVKEVKVKFWPFWVNNVPTLEDHIEIEVKE